MAAGEGEEELEPREEPDHEPEEEEEQDVPEPARVFYPKASWNSRNAPEDPGIRAEFVSDSGRELENLETAPEMDPSKLADKHQEIPKDTPQAHGLVLSEAPNVESEDIHPQPLQGQTPARKRRFEEDPVSNYMPQHEEKLPLDGADCVGLIIGENLQPPQEDPREIHTIQANNLDTEDNNHQGVPESLQKTTTTTGRLEDDLKNSPSAEPPLQSPPSLENTNHPQNAEISTPISSQPSPEFSPLSQASPSPQLREPTPPFRAYMTPSKRARLEAGIAAGEIPDSEDDDFTSDGDE